ncbi:MAG TPA: SAM-dependent methyltransferase [Gammaproteobacteria bacterium]|nr:SAM-dependent methyltransferase [Gammaproteobacteria bacterium]
MSAQQSQKNTSFPDWAASSLGKSLLAMETAVLSDYLSAMRGSIAVQIGSNGGVPLLETCHFPHRFILTDDRRSEPQPDDAEFQFLRSNSDALPFDSDSVDLCLLPHALEFSSGPHELLREVDRVLVSGGHVVMLGFNPYSMWGVRNLFSSRHASQVPWNGRYLSMGRTRDWLRLLDFDINAGTMLYYRPPVRSESMRDRLTFLESAGNRWWPMLAAVYLLVAQKNEAGMTVIEMKKSFRKVSYLNAAEPVAMEGRR